MLHTRQTSRSSRGTRRTCGRSDHSERSRKECHRVRLGCLLRALDAARERPIRSLLDVGSSYGGLTALAGRYLFGEPTVREDLAYASAIVRTVVDELGS